MILIAIIAVNVYEYCKKKEKMVAGGS